MYKEWMNSEDKIVREHVAKWKHPSGPVSILMLAAVLGRTRGSARGAIYREMRRLRELDLRED